MANGYLFTSESVSEGHPDKMADQISDAVLDAILREDPTGRVACETLVKTGVVVVAGEVTTSAWIDLEKLVRETVLDIGYNHSDMGFDGASCGGDQHHRQAVARHRHGRGSQRQAQAGRRRPGPDVRLRHQRDRRADARADHARPPAGQAPGRGAPQRASCRGCGRTPRARSRCATRTTARWASRPWCCRPSTATTSRPRSCAKR